MRDVHVEDGPRHLQSSSNASGVLESISLAHSPRFQFQLSELVSHGLWLGRQGYAQSTIVGSISGLKGIARHVMLSNQTDALDYLRTLNCTSSRKERLVIYLAHYYNWKHQPFTPPRYRRIDHLPFVPLETELDQFIAAACPSMGCYLRVLKETGARPGEAWNLQWIDINFETNTLMINEPEKGSDARQFKISSRLVCMLNALQRPYVFVFRNPAISYANSMNHWRRHFLRHRKTLAEKLVNPRLRRINFKSFRHWRATYEYHQTKDILHVMRFLGHKNIRNTLIYTHLVDFESDDYSCKVANTIKEAEDLIQAGFDYVTEMEGKKLFRKRS
jgi:integrase